MAKYVAGSSVKYGTGFYDSQAHKGVGKEQKALGPSAGENNGSGPTLHTREAVVRDGVEGKGAPKRGYQIDAHTGLHHGPNGGAVGHFDDLRPMRYENRLYSEGSDDHASAHVETAPNRGRSARAEHHPAPGGPAHKFSYMSASGAHGYGHSGGQVDGALRHSGHARGHRIGGRKK